MKPTYWQNQVPTPPFFAVIFVSVKSGDLAGYEETDQRLMAEVSKQPGFLGYSNAASADGGIFISYWQDMASIEAWRRAPRHMNAKEQARSRWYHYYLSLITEVKSISEFDSELG